MLDGAEDVVLPLGQVARRRGGPGAAVVSFGRRGRPKAGDGRGWPGPVKPRSAERVNLGVVPDEPALSPVPPRHQWQKSPKSCSRTQRAPMAAEASSVLPGSAHLRSRACRRASRAAAAVRAAGKTPNHTSPVAGDSLARTRTRYMPGLPEQEPSAVRFARLDLVRQVGHRPRPEVFEGVAAAVTSRGRWRRPLGR